MNIPLLLDWKDIKKELPDNLRYVATHDIMLLHNPPVLCIYKS